MYLGAGYVSNSLFKQFICRLTAFSSILITINGFTYGENEFPAYILT